jgi:hypothetical protein
VARYSLEVKQSAQKELDALDEALFVRLDRKIYPLGGQSPAYRVQKAKGL